MNYRRILSDAGTSLIRSAISILAGLVVIPIITRYIGEAEYGIWATVLSFVGLITTVGGMHLHGALIRYSETETNQTFTDVLSLASMAAASIALIVTVVALGYKSVFGVESLPRGLIVPVGLLIGARIPTSILLNFPRAQQQVKHFEFLSAGRKIVETGTLVAVFWYLRDLVSALWALVGVAIGFGLLLLGVYRHYIDRLPNPTNYLKYLRYGVPMIPKEVAGSLLHHADKFLLLYFLGPVATGVYTAAYSVTTVFPSLIGIFNGTLYPNVTAAWENEEFGQLSRFYTVFLRWYGILSIPAIIGLTLLADSVLRFISTPTIARQGAVLIPILAIAFSLQGLEFSLSYPLTAAEETKRIARITVAAVLVNLVLNVALIPTIGMIGAAVATLMAFCIRTGWLYYYVDEHLNIQIPIQGIGYSILATIGMVAILHLLTIEYWLWKLGLYPPIGAISFGAIFILVGGLKTSENAKIVTVVNRKT
ncbi:oligosaccharide flippase family protein [Haloarcula sediminis]|uniref:oligosaccharide flippase family protein n=1 Tax=Haloarcula sediminis TaxID=3111777 RepID=UPI002D79572F|nr:oligosaccharide flippase family protein [Haloarcula sp. CK38]